MTNDIGENFLIYSITVEIWEAARATFSSFKKIVELLETESKLISFDRVILLSLNILGPSIDIRNNSIYSRHTWHCTEDSIRYQKIIETKCIFKFLLGLNKDLDEVRGRVLSMKPLPSFRETFSTVRYEESHRKVMMGHSPQLIAHVSAFISSRNSDDLSARVAQSWISDSWPCRGRSYYYHCKHLGQTKETCRKLHINRPTGNRLLASPTAVLLEPMSILHLTTQLLLNLYKSATGHASTPLPPTCPYTKHR